MQERVEFVETENGVFVASTVNMPLVVEANSLEEMKIKVRQMVMMYINELQDMIDSEHPFEFVKVKTFIKQ